MKNWNQGWLSADRWIPHWLCKTLTFTGIICKSHQHHPHQLYQRVQLCSSYAELLVFLHQHEIMLDFDDEDDLLESVIIGQDPWRLILDDVFLLRPKGPSTWIVTSHVIFPSLSFCLSAPRTLRVSVCRSAKVRLCHCIGGQAQAQLSSLSTELLRLAIAAKEHKNQVFLNSDQFCKFKN